MNFAIKKFVLTISSFSNLERLDLQHLSSAPLVFKALAETDHLEFQDSLKSLTINACILQSQVSDGWANIQQSDEKVFEDLNTFILKLKNLEVLELQGMSIVDHLQDLSVALRRPKLKALSLPCNGIEAQFCIYFQHVLNFKTLQELDLSSNWFGMAGLANFKSAFTQFA